MFEENGRMEKAGGEISLRQLQEMNTAGDLVNGKLSEPLVRRKLEHLSERLSRIQSWGGAYDEIGFSPDIITILDKQIAPLRNARLRKATMVS
jgi:hypothetical protein